jgi:hypothetical protein
VGETETPVETNALVRFPDGREVVVQLFEQPVEGGPLVGVGLDEGWVADRVTQVGGHSDYVYVIDVRVR